jgi:transketolase
MLAVDAIEKAHSGHPGLPLGAAPMAYVLWDRFLKHNPKNPLWFNRDRFILSAGHGSAMLYSLLHLTGYNLPLQELQNFRQWGSRTPGHPEHGETPGVEVTSGPLGQGFATGVGMSIAERFLAAYFNKPGFPIVDHHTYAIVSDGDLMEGIAAEAASLAGHLRLGKLVYLYDDNNISIEGSTDITFTEDVAQRFAAYRWQVLYIPDGNNIGAIAAAIQGAQAAKDRPSLIIVNTHIGYGSPKQDTAAAHGEPLGEEALRKTKETFGWPSSPPFFVPEEAGQHFLAAVERGDKQEKEWQAMFDNYRRQYPELAAEFERLLKGELPAGWDTEIPVFAAQGAISTRNASQKTMNGLAQKLSNFIGGSADLAPSTKTLINGSSDFSVSEPSGRNIHFGIREHAMGAAVNGMALHGGIIPYGATFLIFSDYMRPAIRLAAFMQTHSIFIFTHDSICLGEDGPTHQAVEHLMSLRAIPGLRVMRPADANETAAVWRLAISGKRPVAMALTRQELPVLDSQQYPIAQGVPRGGYILREAGTLPQVILVATGSEVHLALAAQEKLREQGITTRVVSMPCWEIFYEQSMAYRTEILPPQIPKLAIEAGVTRGWRDLLGEPSDVIGIDRFGASAPWQVVYEKFGFTVENVVQKALSMVKK